MVSNVIKPSRVKESSYAKELEDSRSAILNVLEDYRQSAEDISNSRSAILNVMEDHMQSADDLRSSRRAILNVLDDARQGAEELADSKSALLNILEDLDLNKTALEQEKASLLAIGDGTFIVDANRKITFVNQAFENLLGWKLEEVKGKDAVEVILMEDEGGNTISYDQRPISIVLRPSTTTTTTTTCHYVRKDKIRLPVAVIVSPIIVKNKTVGAVEIFRDITREKEIEKLRVDFLSLASHQLRTPLSGTKWLIETLQRGVLGEMNEKQKEYLRQIHDVNERMIKLAFDMLSALRIESGAVEFKKETVSILKLYEELSLMMESAAKNHGVVLRNALKNHKTITIATDLQMLRNVLECFVSNAINYSQPGQEVTLDLKEETTALVFVVKDTGLGIPKEEQKRIFERFYRASNAKAMKPDGTGLGLYIASMLAEKIGAKILFESEEGKGSTFYLRVPKMVDKNYNNTKA